MKFISHFCFIVIIGMSLLTGCSTIPRTVYFQGDTSKYVPLIKTSPKVLKIAPNDILGVTIASINEESNKLFELPIVGGLRYSGFPNTQSSSMGLQPIGYEVDSSGNIELPLVGKVKVLNLSCMEAGDTIKQRLSDYLKQPVVNVRVLNHKFTVLGEVNRPATYNIIDNTLTLSEALGMAGDLTIFGRRDNITLIREQNGVRYKIRLNLLTQDILTSPYYYIKNGDVIYVEPSEVKSTYNDRSYQMLPIVTSVVSAVTSLGVLILSLRR